VHLDVFEKHCGVLRRHCDLDQCILVELRGDRVIVRASGGNREWLSTKFTPSSRNDASAGALPLSALAADRTSGTSKTMLCRSAADSDADAAIAIASSAERAPPWL
jgi:hypothetical protein